MEGKTPAEVFRENAVSRRDLPAEMARYVWTRRQVGVVGRNGVRFEGFDYYNPEMRALMGNGKRVELRVSIDDYRQGYVFDVEGQFLYEARPEFEDTGVTEEVIRNRNRLRKQSNKFLEKYSETIRELRRERGTNLEGLRKNAAVEEEWRAFADGIANGFGTLDEREVAGGEPLAAIQPRPKRKLRGLLDPD
jgi:hypothetical protein